MDRPEQAPRPAATCHADLAAVVADVHEALSQMTTSHVDWVVHYEACRAGILLDATARAAGNRHGVTAFVASMRAASSDLLSAVDRFVSWLEREGLPSAPVRAIGAAAAEVIGGADAWARRSDSDPYDIGAINSGLVHLSSAIEDLDRVVRAALAHLATPEHVQLPRDSAT